MTSIEIRIALAEWDNWCEIEVVSGDPYGIQDSRYDTSPKLLLDYPNCLNAVHEFEKKLLHPTWAEYVHQLTMLVDSNADKERVVFDCITATASQRCEALLRTLNLWKD